MMSSKPPVYQPILTLLGRADCPTCQEVKATLMALDLQKRTGIHWRFMDLTDPKTKLDFPVEVVPALHFQFSPEKALMIDAQELGEQYGLEVQDPKAIIVFLSNAVKQLKAQP